MRNQSGLDFVLPMAAPDTRAASGASTAELPRTVRVSVPHDVRVNRRALGIEPEMIGRDLDVQRMVLTLHQGEVVFLRYQWVALPPVDLRILCCSDDNRDEYWISEDQTWRRHDELLNCDEPLERIVDRSRHGFLIVLTARHTQPHGAERAIGNDAVVLA